MRYFRWVGVDAGGMVRYVAPSDEDRFGVFESQMIQAADRPDDITAEEFDRLRVARNEE
jgi:hypothetical protein